MEGNGKDSSEYKFGLGVSVLSQLASGAMSPVELEWWLNLPKERRHVIMATAKGPAQMTLFGKVLTVAESKHA